jgi:tight adherence protein B
VATTVTVPVVNRRFSSRSRAVHTAEQLRRALPGCCEDLAASLRAGSSLRQATASAADRTPAPLGQLLGDICERVDRGSGFAYELTNVAHTTGVDEVRLMAAAVTLGHELGGQRALALDRVAVVMRDRLGFDDEVATQATTARLSAQVMVLVPVAFCALSSLSDHRLAHTLISTSLGRMCIGVGFGLDFVGWLWMRRIVRGATWS